MLFKIYFKIYFKFPSIAQIFLFVFIKYNTVGCNGEYYSTS